LGGVKVDGTSITINAGVISALGGGVMGGKSPSMIEVADKDRIAKHGFDKFSFRKEKQE
jgi:hypothetical protein